MLSRERSGLRNRGTAPRVDVLRRGFLLIAVAAALMAGLSASAAQAAFPGPNGRIVYEDELASGFYTVNPDGSARSPILTGLGTATADPAYSADGRFIVFSRGLDLWVAPSSGGAPRRLTTGGNNDRGAAFSPSGAEVVFRRVAADDLFVVRVDGGAVRNLTGDGSTSQESEPAWSPDGAHIAYQLETSSGQGSIYSIEPTGNARTNLTPEDLPAAPCKPDHYRKSSEPSWSPDGSRIAFTGAPVCVGATSQVGSDIWLMNPDGSGKVDIVANDKISEQEPHWAPDGSRIAFISDAEVNEGPGDIYTMDPDGGNVRKVVDRTIKGEDIDWGVAPPPDLAPALTLRFPRVSLLGFLKKGLPITVRTNEVVRATVVLQLARRVARRLGIVSRAQPVTIGRLARTLQPGGRKVRVKPTRKAALRLKRLVGQGRLRRLTLSVRATARDATGHTTARAARVTLRR